MKKPRASGQFDKKFGQFVKKQRIQRGWSQPDLAEKVGNNFQNISRLERGEISPTLYWCYKLADAFEMDMSDLIKEFGYKANKK